MVYNKYLKEIFEVLKCKVDEYNNKFSFRIINNSKGKNLIYLEFVSDDFSLILKDLESSLFHLKKAIDYIENHKTVSDYMKNEIINICDKNSIAHRNLSYLSWQRKYNDSKEKKITSKIISGYSYKGGMGRSSTLAYLTYLFYFLGKKVMILDFDFEAPGIANLLFDKESRNERGGVIDYIIDCNLEEELDLKNYIINYPISEKGGNIYGIHSGIDYDTKNYLNKISKIDFNSASYTDSIRKLILQIEEVLNPDIIIIDSRAGVSESNGFILRNLSDINLFLFNCEDQNKDGIIVIKDIIHEKNSYLLNSSIRYFDKEIAGNKEKDLVDFLKSEKIVFKKIFSLTHNDNFLSGNLGEFRSFCKGQAELFFNTSDKDIFFKNLFIELNDYFFKPIQFLKFEPENTYSLKNILSKIEVEFSKNIASKKFDSEEDLKYFYFKEDLKKIINEQIILILGPKGSGKSTLYEIFTKNYSQIFKHLYNRNNKYIDGFSNKTDLQKEFISSIGIKNKTTARRFWLYFNLYQIEKEFYGIENRTFENVDFLKEKINDSDFAANVEKRLKEINIEFMKKDKVITLVFDELDSMLSENKEIIISSLIENSYSYIYSLPNIKSKILLRNDIYKKLSIENKTHLDNNKYELIWEEKDLFSLILKIILNCLTEKEINFLKLDFLLEKKELNSFSVTKDETDIRMAINYIFGEKLYKAANVGSSYDWIIKLLEDGKKVITPRTMYKFMNEVIKIEISKLKEDEGEREYLFKEISTSQFYKEIFEKVSQDKFVEFDEEYPELKNLYEKIKGIGYTKFTTEEFKTNSKSGKTGKGSTTIEKMKEDLEKLVESGFIFKLQSQYDYQVAHIYSHSMHMKTNRPRK